MALPELELPPMPLTGEPILTNIELLPPELRIQILDYLGLDELKALVEACPNYRIQYEDQRMRFLNKSMLNTLGDVIVHVVAVHSIAGSMSSGRALQPVKYIRDFLREYKKMRASWQEVKKEFKSYQIREIVDFYFKAIQPVMKAYTSYALSNLETITKQYRMKDGQPRNTVEPQSKEGVFSWISTCLPKFNSTPTVLKPLPLSAVEQTRLLQAIYRHQIYHQLFGSTIPHIYLQGMWLNILDGLMQDFVRASLPWEADAIRCLLKFDEDTNFHTKLSCQHHFAVIPRPRALTPFVSDTVKSRYHQWIRHAYPLGLEEYYEYLQQWFHPGQNIEYENSLAPPGWKEQFFRPKCIIDNAPISEKLFTAGYAFWDEARWEQVSGGTREKVCSMFLDWIYEEQLAANFVHREWQTVKLSIRLQYLSGFLRSSR